MMDKWRRKWTSPVVPDYRQPNAKALVDTASSLTEYFNRTVGVWREYEETTNGVGHVVVPHYAPFTPSAVFVMDVFDGSTGHDMGAVHIHSITKDDVDIHFLRANGQDRSSTLVKFYMLCLP
jgi:hypothetical protein